jgi:predicted protein tyrosine phosphatase
MPRIHVCPLARIDETVALTGARSLVTLLNPGTPVERPAAISAQRHLYIGVADIVEAQPGQALPAEAHVRELIAFAGAWDRAEPLLIHCYAGVSRSTAAAFIAACALGPERDEGEIARAARRLADRHAERAPDRARRCGARPRRPHDRRRRSDRPRRGMLRGRTVRVGARLSEAPARGRSSASRDDGAIDQQNDYGADDGDDDAVEVKAGDRAVAERAADVAADDGADHAQHDVHNQSGPGPVDQLAADEAGDQAEHDPRKKAHGENPHEKLARLQA